MRQRVREEWGRLRAAAATLDRQTTFVLTLTALLVLVHYAYGNRRWFLEALGPHFPASRRVLYSFGWWFATQGVLGFLIPVLCLRFLFRRPAAECGIGLGDWKLALTIAGLYLPLVIVGTWYLTDTPGFRAKYPENKEITRDWQVFLVYELLFLTYWIGWEYLWRGFVLFGTRHTFGLYAIFVQMVPFAIRHVDKPFAEGVLSVFGGVALGAVVWRCRSFWIAVPIHAAQMLCVDIWATLRIRTGVSGTGLDALHRLLSG